MNQGVRPTLRDKERERREQIEVGAVDQIAADFVDERLQRNLRSSGRERENLELVVVLHGGLAEALVDLAHQRTGVFLQIGVQEHSTIDGGLQPNREKPYTAFA